VYPELHLPRRDERALSTLTSWTQLNGGGPSSIRPKIVLKLVGFVRATSPRSRLLLAYTCMKR
jgi:hypothetical protein